MKLSRAAYREAMKLDIDAFDILDVLENGYDCERSKRKRGTVERCKRFGKKIVKVVVVDSAQEWNDTQVWLAIHVGVMQ